MTKKPSNVKMSKRGLSARRIGKGKSPKLSSTHTLPDEVTKWLQDGRERDRLDTKGARVAVWAVKENARLKKEGYPSIKGAVWVGGDQMMIRAALDGDAQFFREIADALEEIKEQELSLDEYGRLTTPPLRGAKIFLLDNWDRWELQGVKMDARWIELGEKGFKIARSQFYEFSDFLKKLMPNRIPKKKKE